MLDRRRRSCIAVARNPVVDGGWGSLIVSRRGASMVAGRGASIVDGSGSTVTQVPIVSIGSVPLGAVRGMLEITISRRGRRVVAGIHIAIWRQRIRSSTWLKAAMMIAHRRAHMPETVCMVFHSRWITWHSGQRRDSWCRHIGMADRRRWGVELPGSLGMTFRERRRGLVGLCQR
jgi:hypothetical protein